jgi:hypothetical protein
LFAYPEHTKKIGNAALFWVRELIGFRATTDAHRYHDIPEAAPPRLDQGVRDST